MAVTIALAYSVLQMKEENNLVRHIDASETMGNVNNICTDKTGTLTEGNMFLRSFFFELNDQLANKKVSNALSGEKLSTYSSSLFVKSVVNNITAYAENKKGDIRGNSTEVALLRYLQDCNVENEKFLETNEVKYRIPFKSENKYMGSIFFNKEDNKYHVYLKCAPEILFKFCNRAIGKTGNVENISKEIFNAYLEKQNEYANRCERTLAFTYSEISEKTFNEIEASEKEASNIFDRIIKDKNFILISMVGIADPPRSDVVESIKKCSQAGVFVRMVTGDNINTALAIAREVGILSDYEYNLTKQRNEEGDEDVTNLENVKLYALEGKVFREICGGVNEIYDENSKEKKYLLKL